MMTVNLAKTGASLTIQHNAFLDNAAGFSRVEKHVIGWARAGVHFAHGDAMHAVLTRHEVHFFLVLDLPPRCSKLFINRFACLGL